MPTDCSIEIEGLKELMQQLDPKRMDRFANTAMHGAANIVRAEVKKYPNEGPRPGDWPGFKSEKQRRYFFWALRQGKIEVPYRRGQSPGSEKLGSSWTQRIKKIQHGWEAIIGTRVSYARYVMDKTMQAEIHKGRWNTVQDIAEQQAKNVQQFFDAAVQRWMRK